MERNISRCFIGLLAVLIIAIWLGFDKSTHAAEEDIMGIMTGGLTGTYYQFGLNIEELVASNGIDLEVVNSKGSLENIYAVYKRPNTQLGIVQSDALAFVATMEGKPELKRIASKTKMVFPLYNEEVHLLGKTEIKDFDDLEGRIVAVGSKGSGTYLTTKLLFEISGVIPAEMIALGTDRALTALKNNQIDAMFYVAGYPVKLFTDQVTIDDGLKLLPIQHKNLMEVYPLTQIPENTYNFQVNPVETIAIKSVLISFDFKRANCEKVGQIAKYIYTNLDWLRENGHPKWKSVDLDYKLKGWDQYECVKKYLPGSVAIVEEEPPSRLNPVIDAIEEMFK